MAEGDRQHNQRVGFTRYFVPHPSFRWFNERLALGALGASTLFGLSTWCYERMLFRALGLAEAANRLELSDALRIYAHTTLVATVVSIVFSAVFVIMIATYLSHKIAGPVYRLRQHMLGVMAGEPPRELTFRAGDQLADVSETFNALMRHLGELEAAAPRRVRAEPAPARTDELELDPVS
jgi:hypothetical protein